MYRRIILKLSGEALAGEKGYGLDAEAVRAVGVQVKAALDEGIQIGIVIGGGNFWRGRTGAEINRSKSDQIGMLGTVMNCLYVSEIFRELGMDSTVYTPFAVGAFTKLFDRAEAVKDMEAGKLVFFAGGTGHPYFSTDMGVALKAAETGCEAILMAKSVDGVYDDDPAKNPNAKKFDSLTYAEILSRGLKVIDLTAAAFCMENKIPTKLFALKEQGSILKAVNGGTIGTVITA